MRLATSMPTHTGVASRRRAITPPSASPDALPCRYGLGPGQLDELGDRTGDAATYAARRSRDLRLIDLPYPVPVSPLPDRRHTRPTCGACGPGGGGASGLRAAPAWAAPPRTPRSGPAR